MKAWRVHELGEPTEAMRLDEVPAPEPGSGQVLAAFQLGRKQAAETRVNKLEWVDSLPAGAVQTAGKLGALVGARQAQTSAKK